MLDIKTHTGIADVSLMNRVRGQAETSNQQYIQLMKENLQIISGHLMSPDE